MSIKEQAQNQKDRIQTNGLRYLELKNDYPKINQKNMKKLIKLLEKDQWILDMGVYSSINMKSMAEHIIEAKSFKLWLGYNARPQILLDITTIKFPVLKQLSLAHNQIHSIEAISFINFPKLEEIQFRQNVITSIHSFRKLHLPELKVLSLYRNHVRQNVPITAFKSKNLRTIWLEYEDDEPIQGQSLAFFSKLQSSQLKSIAAATAQRIQEPLLQKSLTRKFQNLKIYRSSK